MQIAWILIKNIALWRIVITVHEFFKKILEAKAKDMFAAWCSDRKAAVISTLEKVEESFFKICLHLVIINFIYLKKWKLNQKIKININIADNIFPNFT